MNIVVDTNEESMIVEVDYGQKGVYTFDLNIPQALWNVKAVPTNGGRE